MDWLQTLNFTLAVGGLALLIVTVGLYIDRFMFKSRYSGEHLRQIAWPAIVAVTVGSVALSLLYSEYFGFIPCSLCWLQRIAIYPQALLSVMAYRWQDTAFFPGYGIALSLFGLAVAIYQYVYQMLPREAVSSGLAPCLLDGSGADCATRVIDEFGFVTFPFLSAVTFAFLMVLYMNLGRARE